MKTRGEISCSGRVSISSSACVTVMMSPILYQGMKCTHDKSSQKIIFPEAPPGSLCTAVNNIDSARFSFIDNFAAKKLRTNWSVSLASPQSPVYTSYNHIPFSGPYKSNFVLSGFFSIAIS